jgi:lipopolysaccharide/colanic/teichoic acid biosynthesis glycosyltransferase
MNSVRQNKTIHEDAGDFRLLTIGLNTPLPEKIQVSGFVSRPSRAGLYREGVPNSDLAFSSGSAGTDLAGDDLTEGSRLYLTSKRIGDATVSAAALLMLFPVLVVIALLVFAEDRGPALYHQERVGKNGRRFRFYKFRSMVQNADALKAEIQAKNEASGQIFKIKDDQRVTRIGRVLRRYSLD